jgi:hypothetical protein
LRTRPISWSWPFFAGYAFGTGIDYVFDFSGKASDKGHQARLLALDEGYSETTAYILGTCGHSKRFFSLIAQTLLIFSFLSMMMIEQSALGCSAIASASHPGQRGR